MGSARGGVWVTGYCRLMGYGVEIPAHQVGGQEKLWDIRVYGLSKVWVMRVSTVVINVELCRFSPVFTLQLEVQVLPCFILADLIFLCMKKFKVSRPPAHIFASISIFILHLMKAKTVFGCLGPLSKVQ